MRSARGGPADGRDSTRDGLPRQFSRLGRHTAREGWSDISWQEDSGSRPGDGPPQPQPPPPPYGQAPYGGQQQYGQPQYPPPGWSPYGPAPSRGTNGLAIASLVLGIVWMWGVTSVLAVIFGLVARRQIKERNESGDGMAIAGLVLGIIGILGTVAMIILFAVVADEVTSYDEFENIDMVRAGAMMLWDDVSAGMARVGAVLPGA